MTAADKIVACAGTGLFFLLGLWLFVSQLREFRRRVRGSWLRGRAGARLVGFRQDTRGGYPMWRPVYQFRPRGYTDRIQAVSPNVFERRPARIGTWRPLRYDPRCPERIWDGLYPGEVYEFCLGFFLSIMVTALGGISFVGMLLA